MLILVAALIWFLIRIRVIFPPLVLAMLIIYLLNPIVTRLERQGVRRAVGAVLTYVIIAGFVVSLIFALSPFVSREIDNIRSSWPTFRTRIVRDINDSADALHRHLGINLDTTQISCLLGADQTNEPNAPSPEQCDAVTKDFSAAVSSRMGSVVSIGSSVLEILLVFLVAPLIALYLLIDLPKIQRDLLALVPERHRAEAADLASKTGRVVAGFFRGQVVLGFIVGVLSAIGFALIGLPFWLLLGALAGIFTLIPVVGGFIAASVAFVVGLLGGGIGLALGAAAVEFVVQQINNHFLNPYVMRVAVRLHPVTVMLSILAGGAVAGFWGILLAVPTVAVTKLLLGHFWETRVLGAEVSPFAPERSAESTT
jgi:predicted PurR-regulated permease PerM